jgi:hypothetical protein
MIRDVGGRVQLQSLIFADTSQTPVPVPLFSFLTAHLSLPPAIMRLSSWHCIYHLVIGNVVPDCGRNSLTPHAMGKLVEVSES